MSSSTSSATSSESTTTVLSWQDVAALGAAVAEKLAFTFSGRTEPIPAYGVPRGGLHALRCVPGLVPVGSPEEALVIIDDIVDSGKTKLEWLARFPDKPFHALVEPTPEGSTEWIVFPWEAAEGEHSPEDAVRRLLQFIGEKPDREGLKETPKRFLKMLAELTAGYGEDPVEHLKKAFTLDDAGQGLSQYDEIILSGPLPFVSLCEHHLAAFEGEAFIGYLPRKGGTVVGLSKLARLLDGYAKRLQVQERLTVQIADALEKVLKPEGIVVVIRARHTCQCLRGVKKDGRMVTSAMRGAFREIGSCRYEIMQLIQLAENGRR